MRIQVIINPVSGIKSKKGLKEEILCRLSSHDVNAVTTQGPKHATLLAQQAAREGVDLIAVVGGDGTINEVAKGIVGTRTALALLPSGSGNGLARHLAIPLDPLQALCLIQNGRKRCIDTAIINDQLYLCAAGVGFDAEVAWTFSRHTFRGVSSYLYAALKEYLHHKPQDYILELDGKTRHIKAFFITFANSSQFGGGAIISPEARIDDGYLDAVIVKPFPFYSLPKILSQLFRGTFHESSYVEIIRCKQIAICKASLKAHIDGEPILLPEGMRGSICPASLTVYY
jgi:diacylglycerol kinase (ATP)